MKLKYLFISFFLVLPILYCVNYKKYLSTVKTEKLVYEIPIVDYDKNLGSINLEVELKIPKYYNFKQYIRNESDCITCGNQEYVFFKNPEKQTVAEGDSVRIGFYKPWEEGRERDEVVFTISTYKNLFSDELNYDYNEEEIVLNQYDRIKSVYGGISNLNKRYVDINGAQALCLDFNINYENRKGKKVKRIQEKESRIITSVIYKKIYIFIELNDLTLNQELKDDFYKIVNSVDCKVSYGGEDEELMELFKNH